MLDNEDIIKLNEVFPDREELQQVKDELKKDISDFKSEILDGQDKILSKIDTLLQEKTFRDDQEKRQKKVLEIHNDALKTNKILTEQQAAEVDNSRAF